MVPVEPASLTSTDVNMRAIARREPWLVEALFVDKGPALKSPFLFLRQLLDQQGRLRRLAAEVGWVLAGQAASAVGALVSIRVLTEHLAPTQYGEVSLALTVLTLVGQVVTGGLTNAIARFFAPASEAQDLIRFLRASLQLMFVAVMISMILGAALLFAVAASGQNQWLGLAASAVVLSIVTGVNGALSGLQNAARQRATAALHAGADAWLKIALAIAVFQHIEANSTAVLTAFVLSSLVVTTSQYIFLWKLVRRRIAESPPSSIRADVDWGARIWSFAWPFSAFGVFTWMQQTSDRWALGMFGTTAEVGIYTVVYQIGYTPIGLLSVLTSTIIAPILYNRARNTTDAERVKGAADIALMIASMTLVLTMIAFGFSLLLHEVVFYFLTSSAFRSNSHLLPWMVLAGGLFAAGQFLLLKLQIELRSKDMIKLKIGTALVGIAANAIGASLYGIEGIIGALVFFSTVYFAWAAFLFRGDRPSVNAC